MAVLTVSLIFILSVVGIRLYRYLFFKFIASCSRRLVDRTICTNVGKDTRRITPCL